jgi:hypothetical protein
VTDPFTGGRDRRIIKLTRCRSHRGGKEEAHGAEEIGKCSGVCLALDRRASADFLFLTRIYEGTSNMQLQTIAGEILR